MGVFSTMVNESFNDYVTEELNVYDYENASMADNLMDEAILASVDIHNEHKSLIESLAAQEISAMEEGYEPIYESSSLSSIGEKIKGLIKKAIEKIKQLFSKVIAVFNSWAKGDKEFIHKYQSTFMKNWTKLRKLDIKCYNYIDAVRNCTPEHGATNTDYTQILEKFDEGSANDNDNSGNAQKTNAFIIAKNYKIAGANSSADNVLSSDDTDDFGGIKGHKKSAYASEKTTAFDTYKSKMDGEDSSDRYERFRAHFLNKINSTVFSNTTNKYSAKEFSDEIFEYLRNGENSKESFDKSELESKGYSSGNIISTLVNNEKLQSNLEKSWRKEEKQLRKLETDLNKILGKIKYNDSTTSTENSRIAYILTQASGLVSLCLECAITYKGAFLQACKEYSRTCKSIVTKVVTMGEKRLAEESYDFGYEDNYDSSYSGFMNSVVIK